MNFQTSNFEFLRNKSSTKPFFKLKFTGKKKGIFFCIFQKNEIPLLLLVHIDNHESEKWTYE